MPAYQPGFQGAMVAGMAGARAGFWIRVGAYLIDAVILIVAELIVDVPLNFALGRSAGALTSLVNLAISLAYFVYFWSVNGGGQTVGMRALKLRVVMTDGSPLTVGAAVVRWIGLFISFLVCFIGVLWVAFTTSKQGWHDLMANTQVVHTGE